MLTYGSLIFERGEEIGLKLEDEQRCKRKDRKSRRYTTAMNHVQNWVENHIESIGKCLGKALVGLDLSDDRLGKVLKELSDDSKCKGFEEELSQNQIQVYDLKTERVRLDSTTASGYWEENKEGLLQRGHSKDHRPYEPFMQSSLGVAFHP
jgi:transposase